jgi:hypothetical protein
MSVPWSCRREEEEREAKRERKIRQRSGERKKKEKPGERGRVDKEKIRIFYSVMHVHIVDRRHSDE